MYLKASQVGKALNGIANAEDRAEGMQGFFDRYDTFLQAIE